MKPVLAAAALAIVSMLVLFAAVRPSPAPSAPRAGPGMYLGYLPGGPSGMLGDLDALEAVVGKKASIVHFGAAWKAREDFGTATFQAIRDRGAIPMINWASWDHKAPRPEDQSDFKLSNITRGDFDAFIRHWAEGARAWGYPFFLRLDHEMNGDWYPWSEKANGNAAGDYVRMWRHVRDIFTAVGATNAVWVWSPNVIDRNGVSTYPLTGLYPGDAYVDWLAMDGYNWGGQRPGLPWLTFTQTFKVTYDALVALSPSKPLMIAETGSVETGGSKAGWFTDMLRGQLEPQQWPRIKALVYFSASTSEADWRIDTSAAAARAWREAITDPFFRSNAYGRIDAIDPDP